MSTKSIKGFMMGREELRRLGLRRHEEFRANQTGPKEDRSELQIGNVV